MPIRCSLRASASSAAHHCHPGRVENTIHIGRSGKYLGSARLGTARRRRPGPRSARRRQNNPVAVALHGRAARVAFRRGGPSCALGPKNGKIPARAVHFLPSAPSDPPPCCLARASGPPPSGPPACATCRGAERNKEARVRGPPLPLRTTSRLLHSSLVAGAAPSPDSISTRALSPSHPRPLSPPAEASEF